MDRPTSFQLGGKTWSEDDGSMEIWFEKLTGFSMGDSNFIPTVEERLGVKFQNTAEVKSFLTWFCLLGIEEGWLLDENGGGPSLFNYQDL